MKFTFLFCLALLVGACSSDGDHPNTCAVIDPIKQLPWLKAAIETYQKTNFADITVEQGEYHSQTVFIITPCCLACDIIPPPVYDCEGKEINNLSAGDEKIKDRKVIWKTPALEAECW